jgi:hypothetical protein
MPFFERRARLSVEDYSCCFMKLSRIPFQPPLKFCILTLGSTAHDLVYAYCILHNESRSGTIHFPKHQGRSTASLDWQALWCVNARTQLLRPRDLQPDRPLQLLPSHGPPQPGHGADRLGPGAISPSPSKLALSSLSLHVLVVRRVDCGRAQRRIRPTGAPQSTRAPHGQLGNHRNSGRPTRPCCFGHQQQEAQTLGAIVRRRGGRTFPSVSAAIRHIISGAIFAEAQR